MSLLTRSPAEAPPPPGDDPFRYGTRYVRKKLADGREVTEAIPLTKEDLLYPQEGDRVMLNAGHVRDNRYLFDVFEGRVEDTPGAFVFGDLRIDFGVPGVQPLGPDLAVVEGIRAWHNWGTLRVGAEEARVRMALEITSPDNRDHDLVNKVDLYYRANVPLYVIVDRDERRGEMHVSVLAYQRGSGGYEPLPPNAEGRIWLESFGVWIGVEGDRAVCYDRDGNRIPDASETRRALRAERRALRGAEAHAALEKDRAEQEKARAEQEKARADQEQSRAEQEKARAELAHIHAEQEKVRADQEQARAEAEAEARREAEQRLRDLEAELRRLRGEP